MSRPQIETEYDKRMRSLTGTQRVIRSLRQLQWTREMIARQVKVENRAVSEQRIRWEVARRLYIGDPKVQQLIQRKLDDVSG